jgi:outer membrane receptor protein involved in Fe transport
MERVEVVKGPQATLFGTAASIGAMSFITRKPEQDFSAEISLTGGEYGRFDLEGYVTGGNEFVQGRLAMITKERDGYVENNSDEADLNGYERFAIRPSLRITPNDTLTIDLTYNHEDADDPGTAFANESVLFTGDTNLSVPDNPNLGLNDVGIERETNDFNTTINWNISEQYSLTYIGAYRDHDSLEVFDADGTEFQFLNFAEAAEGDQTSHELRINFVGDQLNGFAGLSYFAEEAEQDVPFYTDEGVFLSCLQGGLATCNSLGTFGLTNGALSILPYEAFFNNTADNSSLSIFADLSYQLADTIELTAGIRYAQEDRESTYSSVIPVSVLLAQLGTPADLFGGTLFNTGGATLSADSDNTTLLPRLSVRWQATDLITTYANVSLGERSEVIQLSSGQPELIPAEEIINYEIGVKGTSQDNTLSYAVTAFYQDYENFQVTVFDVGSGETRTENAGNATNGGLEADINWQINSNIRLLANAAYIDAGIDDDSSNGEFAGNNFRLQPEFTGAISAFFNYPIAQGIHWVGLATLTYRDEVFFDTQNQYQEDSVSLLNLKTGIEAPDGNWSVMMFADNILDEEYIIDGGNTGGGFGFPTFIEGAPSMIGFTFTKHFD